VFNLYNVLPAKLHAKPLQVVASLDWPSLVKYKGLVSAQPHRQEVIQDLSAMVK